MARLNAYLLLATLAAVSYVAVGRPESIEGLPARESNDDHLFVSIKSMMSPENWCLDVLGRDAVLNECEAGVTSQLWYFNGSSIVNYNGRCLDGCTDKCQYPEPQRNAFVRPCSDAPVQQWQTDGDLIINQEHNTCLDVCHAEGWCKPNPDATTLDCHKDLNQRWELILGGYFPPTSAFTTEDPKP